MNIIIKQIPSEYDIKVRVLCSHYKVQVMSGEVMCTDCRKVLSDRELGFYL